MKDFITSWYGILAILMVGFSLYVFGFPLSISIDLTNLGFITTIIIFVVIVGFVGFEG